MIRFIIALLILVAAVSIGYLIRTFPAELVIHYADQMISMNLVVWLILSFVFSVLALYLLKMLIFVWRSPKLFSRNLQTRKERKAHTYLHKGLSELALGHYSKAEKHLIKGAKLNDELGKDSVIFYENAAIAATYQQADERRNQYLLKARQKAGEQQLSLTYLSEAQMYVDSQDYDKAQPLLEKLYEREPKNIKIISLLDATYAAQKQWQKAWSLLPQIKSQLGTQAYEARKTLYAKGLLTDTAEQESYAQLESAWKKLPKDVRQDPAMIIEFSNALVENAHPQEAQRLLTTEIKRTHDLTLIQAYSQLENAQAHEQLSLLDSLSGHFSDNAIFHYAYALTAYRAKRYEIASKHIEQSLKLKQTAEAFALWGQILEAQQQPRAALAAYRQSVHQISAKDTLEGDFLPLIKEQYQPLEAPSESSKNP